MRSKISEKREAFRARWAEGKHADLKIKQCHEEIVLKEEVEKGWVEMEGRWKWEVEDRGWGVKR